MKVTSNVKSIQAKILIKYDTENYIGRINKKMELLRVEWANFQFS